jgi:diacylglycerol kinase
VPAVHGLPMRRTNGFNQIKRKKMKPDDKGFKRLVKGFGYAFSGLKEMVKSEQNANIHLLVVVFVTIAGFVLKINAMEWCVVLLCIALVLAAEAFNTAIERLTDHLFKERHETARIVKDVSAGSVLVCAIISVICGIIIFLPKLIDLIFGKNINL